jgi:hypothetical protein
MFTPFAVCIAARNLGLFSGNGPDCFTAMAISFPNRLNALAILSKRANILYFLFSKTLPINYFSALQIQQVFFDLKNICVFY